MSELLTTEYKVAIRGSWDVIKADLKGNGMALFIKLFTDHPEYKAIFPNFRGRSIAQLQTSIKLQSHANKVMTQITVLVDNLDDMEEVVRIMSGVVKDHYTRAVRIKHYENLFTVLAAALAQILGDSWTDDVERAWGVAIQILLSIAKLKLDALLQA